MKKKKIVNLIEKKHQELFSWLAEQEGNYWEKKIKDRWTTGQHIQHLVSSIKAVNHILSFPFFILKMQFGIANREVRSYEEVVKKYQEKLEIYKDQTKIYNQKVVTPSKKKLRQLLTTLEIQNKKLQYKTQKIKDYQLDNLVLPHPLMGKMILREIIMWTAYHTEHHTKDLIKNYS